jgi:hypothetical protein
MSDIDKTKAPAKLPAELPAGTKSKGGREALAIARLTDAAHYDGSWTDLDGGVQERISAVCVDWPSYYAALARVEPAEAKAHDAGGAGVIRAMNGDSSLSVRSQAFLVEYDDRPGALTPALGQFMSHESTPECASKTGEHRKGCALKPSTIDCFVCGQTIARKDSYVMPKADGNGYDPFTCRECHFSHYPPKPGNKSYASETADPYLAHRAAGMTVAEVAWHGRQDARHRQALEQLNRKATRRYGVMGNRDRYGQLIGGGWDSSDVESV